MSAQVIKKAIACFACMSVEEISDDALIDSLPLDSLDHIEIIMMIEDDLVFEIDEESALLNLDSLTVGGFIERILGQMPHDTRRPVFSPAFIEGAK